MPTLITGGTGLIGAGVARLLVETEKNRPHLFDINPSAKLLDGIENQIEMVRGDLGNFSHVLNAVEQARPEVIYHLGGMLSVPSDADPAAAMRANALGTFHVLEAARLFDVRQVLFSSTLATYGMDLEEEADIGDATLQRPILFYGATKVFGEHMGLVYRRKYGLDFRSVRYPSIVGPGVKTPGIAQYNSWVIEESAQGRPYTIYVKPETRHSILYIKDAARALVDLGRAAPEHIKTINYLLSGIDPPVAAGQLAELVRARIPGAQIDFETDEIAQSALERVDRKLDDSKAQQEWGWKREYGAEEMIDDFLEELKNNPQRYE